MPLLAKTGTIMRAFITMKQAAWLRPIAFGALVLFLLSWIFPLAAGLAKNTSMFPKWWGAVDVVLAFVLALAAFGFQAVVQGGYFARFFEQS